MNGLSEILKTSLAIQLVIMDAMDKGHSNTEELIKYMKTEIFEIAVERYCSLIDITNFSEIK
jgi:hypothetical protein